MAAPYPINPSQRVGEDFKFYATATAVDLTAVSGKPPRCARRIVAMAAGNWTLLKGASGVDEAPGAVFQGFMHDADTAVLTSDAAVMVYW